MQVEKEEIIGKFKSDASEHLSSAMIRGYLVKYPEYAEELLELSVSLIKSKFSVTDSPLDENEKEKLMEAGSKLFAEFHKTNKVEISSIIDRIKQLGLEMNEITSKLGITKYILLSLDHKTVVPDTVPQRLLKKFSEYLQIPSSVMREYFDSEFEGANAMQFKARSTPTSKSRITFKELIESDSSLTEEQKAALLI